MTLRRWLAVLLAMAAVVAMLAAFGFLGRRSFDRSVLEVPANPTPEWCEQAKGSVTDADDNAKVLYFLNQDQFMYLHPDDGWLYAAPQLHFGLGLFLVEQGSDGTVDLRSLPSRKLIKVDAGTGEIPFVLRLSDAEKMGSPESFRMEQTASHQMVYDLYSLNSAGYVSLHHDGYVRTHQRSHKHEEQQAPAPKSAVSQLLMIPASKLHEEFCTHKALPGTPKAKISNHIMTRVALNQIAGKT